MKTVSPVAIQIFSGLRKMISPNCSHSAGSVSVMNPSARSRSISRATTSFPSGGHSAGSALSSCIFFDEANEVIEFKRLAHVIVGAAVARFVGDVAIAGEDDVRDVLRLRMLLERTAKRVAAHPFDGEVGEDQRRLERLRALER